MNNPLVTTILALLKKHVDGISEFDILVELKQQYTEFNQLAEDSNLLLFRQHFFIMNALYQLQASLWQDEKMMLFISPLKIKILPSDQVELSANTQLTEGPDAKLAAYYLDWDEYQKTDAVEVSKLLNSFFEKMNLPDERLKALTVLQLEDETANKISIKRQYRKLAQKYHPDQGGSADRFIDIRQAYEYLML